MNALAQNWRGPWRAWEPGRGAKKTARWLIVWWAVAWLAAVLHPCLEALASSSANDHAGHPGALTHHQEHGNAQPHSHAPANELPSHCLQLTDLSASPAQASMTLAAEPQQPALREILQEAVLLLPRWVDVQPQSFSNYHPPPAPGRFCLRTLRLRI